MLNLQYQKQALNSLEELLLQGRHSILLEGCTGSGKSYLAKMSCKCLDTPDFYSVQPTVNAIRESMSVGYDYNTPIVYCVENLDLGVPGASYTLLKFLEEPSPNVYIIVTCRSMYDVPDTIVSRSSQVYLKRPLPEDIRFYAQTLDLEKYNKLQREAVWSCVHNLSDVDRMYALTDSQLADLKFLPYNLSMKDSVSAISWKLTNCGGSEKSLDPQLVISYLMNTMNDKAITYYGQKCIDELQRLRVGAGSVITKFAFDVKYGRV